MSIINKQMCEALIKSGVYDKKLTFAKQGKKVVKKDNKK